MSASVNTVQMNEADFLLIIEALELLQKQTIDKLRDDYDSIRDVDRDYFDSLPGYIARVQRKIDTGYDGLKGKG